MKKLIFLALFSIALLTTENSNAQFKAGAGLAYGTDVSNIGFTLNAGYNFTENWAGEVDFSHFFRKDYVAFSALDFDANYVFDFGFYPIAGINMTFVNVDVPELDLGDWGSISGVSASTTEIGLNIGAGYNFYLNDALVLSPEMRYTLGGADYFRIGVKLMYVFE
ncbi:MAG: outer membrane beta-barrel protein [Chlorobi bacterium]|nr:outer membrane beta-barrel protein [Chlorobiota bacterium]